jgi:hypothetical protein
MRNASSNCLAAANPAADAAASSSRFVVQNVSPNAHVSASTAAMAPHRHIAFRRSRFRASAKIFSVAERLGSHARSTLRNPASSSFSSI